MYLVNFVRWYLLTKMISYSEDYSLHFYSVFILRMTFGCGVYVYVQCKGRLFKSFGPTLISVFKGTNSDAGGFAPSLIQIDLQLLSLDPHLPSLLLVSTYLSMSKPLIYPLTPWLDPRTISNPSSKPRARF